MEEWRNDNQSVSDRITALQQDVTEVSDDSFLLFVSLIGFLGEEHPVRALWAVQCIDGAGSCSGPHFAPCTCTTEAIAAICKPDVGTSGSSSCE